MSIELRQLRSFVAVAEAGTFTDAAIDLGLSQAAVSRSVAGLEATLGVRLIHRTTRSVSLTPAGERAIAYARRAIAAVGDLEKAAREGAGTIRLGYAWSALGGHTAELQHRWEQESTDTELLLVKSNTPTAGLQEGASDMAILRRVPQSGALAYEQVGVERRFCAMASDDVLARRRTVTLAQIAGGAVAIDSRTGSTTVELWPEGGRPAKIIEIHDIDDWLTVIGSGRARGVTAESTTHQYRRQGVVYRPVRDAPAIPVSAAWRKGEFPASGALLLGLLKKLYGGLE